MSKYESARIVASLLSFFFIGWLDPSDKVIQLVILGLVLYNTTHKIIVGEEQ